MIKFLDDCATQQQRPNGRLVHIDPDTIPQDVAELIVEVIGRYRHQRRSDPAGIIILLDGTVVACGEP